MLLHTQNPLKFAFSTEDPDNIPELSFGIIGVPFDSTATYLPGTRFGPQAIREASYSFESYNLRFSGNVKLNSFDFGDVNVSHGNFRSTSKFIRSSVSEILEMGLKPIILGGEHTVTLPVLEEFSEGGLIHDLTVIHIDAHMDMADTYTGERYSHATVMRRVHELQPSGILQLGVRSASEEEVEFVRENGIEYHTAHEIMDNPEGALRAIRRIRGPVYLSVDIDVLDPAYAPSVGNPTPCGLTPFIMEELTVAVAEKELLGFDVVEVASGTRGDQTSINAAKIIYDILTIT